MIDWLNFLVRVDFTDIGEMFEEIPLGLLDDNNQRLMASILDSYGPAEAAGKWNMDPLAEEYSLNGAEIVFHAENHRDLPTFSTYKYALGVRFPERSVGPVGILYLCWNDPKVEEPTDPVAEE